jgi:Rad3-related DNA helicase
MTHHRTTHILARLETGFRTDAAHLKKLEADLTTVLHRAREFGTEHGSPDEWNTNWHQRWNDVEGILRRIRRLVREMDGSIESSDRDRLKAALEVWETIQAEDVKLVEALSTMRAQTNGLNAACRKDWNLLADTLETHMETIRACAQALRIKLELLKKHSKEEVDHLVQEILAQLPNRTQTDGMEADNYEREYLRAAAELEKEHHKYLGFVDTVKALLMWVESTEERTHKNLSLRVEPT